MPPLSVQNRRTVLRALSLAPLPASVPQEVLARAQAARLISADVLLLQPAIGEGPFDIEPAPMRADLGNGSPGLPMQLRLQVVSADCTPVVGARVEIWQWGAKGGWSAARNPDGPDTSEQTCLRGTQITDDRGVVAFQTIFPGMSPGCVTGVHFRVGLKDQTALTGHIYFDDAVNRAIHEEHAAYTGRTRAHDTVCADDAVAQQAWVGSRARVRMTAPDGEMEAAVVVVISPDGQTGELLGRLWETL